LMKQVDQLSNEVKKAERQREYLEGVKEQLEESLDEFRRELE